MFVDRLHIFILNHYHLQELGFAVLLFKVGVSWVFNHKEFCDFVYNSDISQCFRRYVRGFTYLIDFEIVKVYKLMSDVRICDMNRFSECVITF